MLYICCLPRKEDMKANNGRYVSPYLEREEELVVTRGALPHWHQDEKLQFVTCHLSDSIPEESMRALKIRRTFWLNNNPRPWNRGKYVEYRKLFNDKVETWLDSGYGSCVLRDKNLADIVVEALDYHDGNFYDLLDYVVMPNHVHVLIRLCPNVSLTAVVSSWKIYTTRRINMVLNRRGRLWHNECWDRMIRDKAHLLAVKDYIGKNVRHGGVRWKI